MCAINHAKKTYTINAADLEAVGIMFSPSGITIDLCDPAQVLAVRKMAFAVVKAQHDLVGPDAEHWFKAKFRAGMTS